jgi:hypothetical protein
MDEKSGPSSTSRRVNLVIIHHITLLTGHSAVHRLDTLSRSAVDACRSLLPAGGPIPGFAPFRVQIHGSVFTVWRGREPIVTCGFGRGSDETWSALIDLQSRFGAVIAQPTASAWLAVALLPGLASVSPEDVKWLGDFERCMASAMLLPS